MSDWADDAAKAAYLKCHWKREHDEPIIAAAIRAAHLRGRIAGLREAAALNGNDPDFPYKAMCKIMFRADALERGKE